jgi:hypothetical protein
MCHNLTAENRAGPGPGAVVGEISGRACHGHVVLAGPLTHQEQAFGISPSLNLLRRRLADSKRHACYERVKDAVLEELSPKNVIPPEQPEKVPNPDPATVGETPMILTGRTISPRPLTLVEKRAVVAMQAHLRCDDLLAGKANRARIGSADGRGPADLPATAHDRRQREHRSRDPDRASGRQPRV